MEKKYIVWVCMMSGNGRCKQKGSGQVLETFQEEVNRRCLENVMITPTGCTNRHESGPAVAVDPDDVWYCHVTSEDVPEIVREHILHGRPLQRLMCPI